MQVGSRVRVVAQVSEGTKSLQGRKGTIVTNEDPGVYAVELDARGGTYTFYSFELEEVRG